MAEITGDGRYIIQVPFNGTVKVKAFSGLRGVTDYLTRMRQRLGDDHPFIVELTDEYSRFLAIRDAAGPRPLGSGAGRLSRHIVPNVLFAHNGQVTTIMPPAVAAWFERNYFDRHLDDDARLAAIRHVSRLQTDEYYRACVAEAEAKAEAEAAASFNAAATPAPEPTEWGPHLPARAPRLWIDRDKETEADPADFIRQVYGEWLPHLSKRDLLYLDRSLYFAYAKWLGGDGKDTPPVEFGGNPRGRLDDAAYGAAMRQKNQTGIAKLRAAKRDRGGLTHSP